MSETPSPPIPEPPSKRGDEYFASKAAFFVMALVSALALVMRYLISSPFSFNIEFETALIYVPTIALLILWFTERRAYLRDSVESVTGGSV